MTVQSIEDAMKISFVYEPTTFPEICNFSVHTARRTESDYEALFGAANAYFVGEGPQILAPCTLRKITLSDWATGPGFTGWHQRAVKDYTTTTGSGAAAPHQLAVVLGWRNTDDFALPLGRRRNRLYLGPVQNAIVGTDTRMTTTIRDAALTRLRNFSSALQLIPSDLLDDDFSRLVVTSPAGGAMFTCDQLTAGRRLDTQRRRNEHTPEEPSIVTVP
jgi:hypothetical protein